MQDITLGIVNVVFRGKMKSAYDCKINTARPAVAGNDIIFPNYKETQFIKFARRNEGLILARQHRGFGSEYNSVIWCGDRNGKPFLFNMNRLVANCSLNGNYDQFLEYIKPHKIKIIEEECSPLAKGVIHDLIWSVPIAVEDAISFFTAMKLTRPNFELQIDQFKAGEKTIVKGKMFYYEHGSPEWLIGKDLSLSVSTGESRILKGLHLLQMSRFTGHGN